jgi:uncharacterized membrane protein
MPRTKFQTTFQASTLATLTLLVATLTLNLAAQSGAGQLLRRKLLNGRSQSGAPAAAPAGLGSNPFLLIDYPGGIANQFAAGINDKGKIVGIVGLPDGSFHGYLLQGKTFKQIDYPGAPASGAFAINKSGLIVGFYCDDISCNTGHGFSLMDKNFTPIDYPGGMNTEASGVNAAGDITGSYQSSDGVLHGFLLHKGTFTSFDMPGSVQTAPLSINKQGTIVGDFYANDGNGGHGFILQGGVFTQVDYPGAYGTGLYGINDSGDMVGGEVDSQGIAHGFLLSGGVFTVFDVPFPGQVETGPNGLNNNHQIVGSYGSYGSGQPDYFFGFLTTY